MQGSIETVVITVITTHYVSLGIKKKYLERYKEALQFRKCFMLDESVQ